MPRLSSDRSLYQIPPAVEGRLFQVTPSGEIVWEYTSPIAAPLQPIGFGEKISNDLVYRARRVPVGWR